MDPKQTSPLGGTPVGGQEGQNPSSASAGANSGASPVFSSGTDSAPAGTPASDQKMPGTLGAENLSTGANVSRTMDSLNSKNQSETGTSVFSKHKFDRAEPDGSILIPESQKGLFFRKSKGGKENDTTGSMIAARGETTDGLDPETRRKRKMMRIGGIIGASLAAILAITIVVVLVAAPKKEKPKATTPTGITVEQAFEEYANYLLTGDKEKGLTDEEMTNIFASNTTFNQKAYANKSIDSSEPSDYQYIDNLNNYYNTFYSLYNGEMTSSQLNYLPAYYYNLARGKKFSEQDVRDRFSEENDEEKVKSYIREFVNPDTDRYDASRYLGLKYKYLVDYANVLVEARDKNCSVDGYGDGEACSLGDTYKTYIEDKTKFEAESKTLEKEAQKYAASSFVVLFNELLDNSIIEKPASEVVV